jgi:hypothetical protein
MCNYRLPRVVKRNGAAIPYPPLGSSRPHGRPGPRVSRYGSLAGWYRLAMLPRNISPARVDSGVGSSSPSMAGAGGSVAARH